MTKPREQLPAPCCSPAFVASRCRHSTAVPLLTIVSARPAPLLLLLCNFYLKTAKTIIVAVVLTVSLFYDCAIWMVVTSVAMDHAQLDPEVATAWETSWLPWGSITAYNIAS